jgi:hypothetical protein
MSGAIVRLKQAVGAILRALVASQLEEVKFELFVKRKILVAIALHQVRKEKHRPMEAFDGDRSMFSCSHDIGTRNLFDCRY